MPEGGEGRGRDLLVRLDRVWGARGEGKRQAVGSAPPSRPSPPQGVSPRTALRLLAS